MKKIFENAEMSIKLVAKGGWVCWKNLIAVPLVVSLLSSQTFYKSHMKCDRMLPIKHKKEPLDKVLEAHLPADLMQH
jgi:hypothetical protein